MSIGPKEDAPPSGRRPDGAGPTGGEPNRRMRFLDNWLFDDDPIELPMFALVDPPFFGLPRLQNEGQGFHKNLVGIHHVDTEDVELVAAIPLNDTKIEAPVGDKIQCRRLFRQQNQVVPRKGHCGGAGAQCRRLCSKVRHQFKRRRNLAETGKMMLGREGAAKIQRLHLDIIFDPIPIPGWTIGVRQPRFCRAPPKIPSFMLMPAQSRSFIYSYMPRNPESDRKRQFRRGTSSEVS